MKTLKFLALAACSFASASAAYVYDFPSLLNPYTATQWTKNGTLTTSNNMVTTTNNSTGGSLILIPTVPGLSNSYEVRTTLTLPASGGDYYTYLRATSDALSGGTGTWYYTKINTPTFSGNSCSAGLAIAKRVSGVITTLVNTTVPCNNGMVVRSVMTATNYILVYINNALYASVYDASISSGQPGVGVKGAPAGNGITAVDIGHLDTVAPPAPAFTTTSFRDRVDLQYLTAADDTNGIGIAYYTITRNGTQVADTASTYFSDFTATANTTYSYSVQAVDYHGNSASTSQNVTVPATVVDPRQTGIRPTGSYWGGGGEQIDVRSGNLNYTIPMLKAMGRGGWGVGFNLSYNSQNWRQDTSGTWQNGLDTGYGYGWRLAAGSLTPLYSSAWVLAGYLFIDSTGAEYRLTTNTSGVWTSNESIYIYYDSTAARLYFTNGSFWTFGSTSATTEQDAGTMYPTLMEDTNGNQVFITYDAAAGAPTANNSSRINTIEDVRSKGISNNNYTFTYAYLNPTDPFPHLTKISNGIASPEKFFFAYTSAALISPFDHVTSYGTFAFLQTETKKNLNPSTFTYDSGGSGELAQVTTPYGGHLRWTYAPYTLATTLTYREVQNRYLSMSSGAAETLITLVRGSDSTYNVHQTATLDDTPANAEKVWTFETNTGLFNGGLQSTYEERTLSTHSPLSHLDFGWAQTPTTSNPYIFQTTTTLDPGQTYQTQKQTCQLLDQYGNLVNMWVHNFGTTYGTVARKFTNTYSTNANLLSRYMFNRLRTSTVTDGTNSTNLVTNNYDERAPTSVTGLHEHDDTNYPATFTYRGNVTSYGTPTTSATTYYDMTGNVTKTVVNGVTTTVTTDSTTNFAAPTQMTTNTLSSGMTWTSALAPSTATGPNGDSGGINYDTDGRPTTTTSPYGAVTTYGYNDTASPPSKSVTTNGHGVTTIMDGFGRTIQTTSGAGTTLSIVDAEYAPCGCSPLGKLSQQSQPYAPGGSDAWTVYHYDASGRTTSVVLPDGSTTSYVYGGAVVAVTDPAGKSKSFIMDALGNLTTVVETDPVLGQVLTNYTYDILNHLTQVSMPRSTVTQTRTFNYTSGTTVGAFLLSATNPENGTVSYTYSNGLIASKTDAKGQQLTYQYDTYHRLTSVTWANAPNGAQVLRTYYYDTNPLDGTFSQYAAGRLTAVQYAKQPFSTNPLAPGKITMVDMYSYTQAGLPAAKRLQVNELLYWNPPNGSSGTGTTNLDSTYTYNNEGKVTGMVYPTTTTSYTNGVPNNVAGASYNYSYDTMYRLSGMTDSGSNTIVSNVSYDAANRLLTMNYPGANETRSYNVLGQLTNIHAGSSENVTYNYPTGGTNNGKASSISFTGETVTYQYDSLNRLISATSSASWTETYGYDAFGNLLSKSQTGGAPTLSQAVNAANNQIVGHSYDANGNEAVSGGVVYDVENRISGAGWANGAPIADYAYDAQGKRFFMWNVGTVDGYLNDAYYSVVMYSPSGQKLAVYQIHSCNHAVGNQTALTLCSTLQTSDKYFGGRRLAVMDQLGSAGTYYPWGEAKGTTNPQDAWSYATYWRDSVTGLDYANQRYYSNTYGRFMTPDPSATSQDPSSPQSWNRYIYVSGDPVNNTDPSGLGGEGGDLDDNGSGLWGTTGKIAYKVKFGADSAPGEAARRSKFPECNKQNLPGIENELNFIVSNYAAATSVAQQVDSAFNTNINAQDILGWAGNESTWGTNNTLNKEDYNQAAGSNWLLQTNCPTGANPKWACFSGFENSSLSAFFSSFLVTYTASNGQTFNHASAGFILSDQLAQGASLAAAFQMVAQGQGATGGWDHFNTSYGANVVKTINGIQPHLDCLKKYDYIH